MVISLLHPSRQRPERSFNNAVDWINKAGCDVELIVSIDADDPTKIEYGRKYVNIDNVLPGNFKFLINPNTCVVEATNKAAEVSTGDILLYLSDDFKCFENWGNAVIEEFEKYVGPTLIKVDDCLQQFRVAVLTIPIMNRQLYNRLGYFWHPEYKSMFVDEHLYHVSKKLGALKFAPHLKFEHQHACVGKADNDETYMRSSAHWNQGKEMFNKHKSMGFPV